MMCPVRFSGAEQPSATRRSERPGQALRKLFAPTLEKALVFLDNALLPATSTAVERGNRKRVIGVVVSVMVIEQLEQQYTIIKLDYSRPIGIYMTDGTLIASLPHRDNLIGEKAPELTHEPLPTKAKGIISIQHISGDGSLVKLAVGHLEVYP